MSDTATTMKRRIGPTRNYEWPSDELIEIAISAMVQYPGSIGDSSKCYRAILDACFQDLNLLQQFIIPRWHDASSDLVRHIRRVFDAMEDAGIEPRTERERVVAKIFAAEREDELRWQNAERDRVAARRAEADRKFEIERAAWLNTQARQVTINNRPFWEVSTREARNWQKRQQHHTRFIDLLLSGVPEDDRPISYYRRPDEVNDLWRRAREN